MNNLLLSLLSLGVIQGISEFLPISSSGHLVLFESIPFFRETLDASGENMELFVNVSLHLATLMAVVIYLWRDIIRLSGGLISGISQRNYKKDEIRVIINIIAASIPAGILGVLFHGFFERLFTSYTIVFFMLIINGLVLLSTKIVPIKNRKLEEIGVVRSVLVGICQSIAIIPGISRSGSTIAGGIILGLNPGEAARFSFLMAIPVITGAGLLEILKVFQKEVSFTFIFPLIVSMFVTMIVGLISLKVLFILVKKIRIDIFGYYTILLGILGIIYIQIR
ncbi:MAG: undecaprenyl-diphosphate phosphatase [Spirochaetota bacterium]|nr:undecaprenyl-diphosphate phosphatase [Spirochaetota bacterium]